MALNPLYGVRRANAPEAPRGTAGGLSRQAVLNVAGTALLDVSTVRALRPASLGVWQREPQPFDELLNARENRASDGRGGGSAGADDGAAGGVREAKRTRSPTDAFLRLAATL